MPEYFKGLVDARGRPIEKKLLTQEVAGPAVTAVRSPLTGYPGDGLTPPRLTAILKEADQGQPLRFYELAEQIEEKDLHYAAVLGVRKRSVSQLEITIEDGSDAPEHQKQAEAVRTWLKRDELRSDLFDMLDGIGKGESFTEIMWDTSEGQWNPKRLEWRDQRWFRPAREDLTTPTLITGEGQDMALPAGKFIHLVARGKSGIPARAGLARLAAWFYLFKQMTLRDWAIYTATFGIPMRVGKYGPNASEADKDTLFRAVASIAGDCAAIIPNSMVIEFQQPPVGNSTELFEKRADWLDRQMSKATLGQTTTTDAISGGHAVSQEHRLVQEDIERADAKVLAAALTRDLVIPWMQLEYGPQTAYPRVVIGRPEQKDVNLIVSTVKAFRLPVKKSEAYALAGVSQPEAGDEVVEFAEALAAGGDAGGERNRPSKDQGKTAKGKNDEETDEARHSVDPGVAEAVAADRTVAELAADAEAGAAAAMDAILELIGGIVAKSSSLEEVRSRLLDTAPQISTRSLAMALRQAQVVARLTGRGELADG